MIEAGDLLGQLISSISLRKRACVNHRLTPFITCRWPWRPAHLLCPQESYSRKQQAMALLHLTAPLCSDLGRQGWAGHVSMCHQERGWAALPTDGCAVSCASVDLLQVPAAVLS